MDRTKHLTSDEARHALYIDFEGRKLEPPVLLGCTRRSRVGSETSVWQAITDPVFRPLAEADGLELLALADAVERILQRAERRDRLIVAWSRHERDVIEQYCPQHLERFDARFVNARAFAERWRNKVHGGEKPAPGRLVAYLEVIGYGVPTEAAPDRVGVTIDRLRGPLSRGRTVPELTDNQRQRWRDLRSHNRHDCTGMRSICVLAADEVAAADGRRTQRRPIDTLPMIAAGNPLT
jgi:hypothetical protein